jgi:phosphoribosylformylglycinamidine synthase I
VKFGIIRFPGSCDDTDAQLAASRVGEAVMLWHADRDLQGVDAVIVPGGFSYGDYLRAGAIARFAPVMEEVAEFARDGGLVLGICNGFQVLCEARLLPGALLPNTSLRFICRQVLLDVVRTDSAFTRCCKSAAAPSQLSIPVKHTTGRYYAPPDELERMRSTGQVLLRYAPGHNPNGSADDIAGVCNERGNVFGLMPHPEHAVDPLTGSGDGLSIFESIRAQVGDRVVA